MQATPALFQAGEGRLQPKIGRLNQGRKTQIASAVPSRAERREKKTRVLMIRAVHELVLEVFILIEVVINVLFDQFFDLFEHEFLGQPFGVGTTKKPVYKLVCLKSHTLRGWGQYLRGALQGYGHDGRRPDPLGGLRPGDASEDGLCLNHSYKVIETRHLYLFEKRETLACLSKAPRMTAKVLIVEPDASLRGLLESLLTAHDYQVTAADPTDPESTLRKPEVFGTVFWSSACPIGDEELVRSRMEHERWILMIAVEDSATSRENTAFETHLRQPFREADLMAALRGEDPPAEDPILSFMRSREKDYALYRKKESQLREAQRHQKELERMKNTFLSLVSHELRTPLTIISGNLHVMKKLATKWDNTVATECVEHAFDGTKRLAKLVDELLRFTISVPQNRDRWDLGLTLRRVVGELQPLAHNRGLDLSLSGQEKLDVEGDPAGLPDAIYQLIENALVFNSPGGKVDVTAEILEKGKWVRIEVIDDGPGIKGEELDRVFRPFYQVADVNTRSVEGLGIGLSLARRTIEGHGGTLELKSIVGVGTKALIKLPVRSQLAIPLATARTVPQPPAQDDVRQLKAYAQELYEFSEAERVRRRHAEEQKKILEHTFVDTLVSLIRMVDPRMSGGTSQGERVLNYARAVARHLDPTLLSRPEFLYSLLLYDIGKIGVAESVLSKSGMLTDQEMVSARAHAEIGADLLTSVGVLRPAIDAVRSHHERWDGSGYPDGLTGKEIPLLARIIAVVDSFDAMTVDRPYREAMSLEKAHKNIVEGAGEVFDPEVVAAFGRAWTEIQEAAGRASKKEKSALAIQAEKA
jgi:response regulator RpfG family c-di-GMP phosphodiesterase